MHKGSHVLRKGGAIVAVLTCLVCTHPNLSPTAAYAHSGHSDTEIMEDDFIVDGDIKQSDKAVEQAQQISGMLAQINWKKQGKERERIFLLKDTIDEYTEYALKYGDSNTKFAAYSYLDEWLDKVKESLLDDLSEKEKENIIERLEKLPTVYNVPSISIYKLSGDESDKFDAKAYREELEGTRKAAFENMAQSNLGVNDDTQNVTLLPAKESNRPFYLLIFAGLAFSAGLLVWNQEKIKKGFRSLYKKRKEMHKEN